MENSNITTIIGGIVALIVALLPNLKKKLRIILIATIIGCALLSLVINAVLFNRKNILAAVVIGQNSAPAFLNPIGGISEYEEVEWTVVIKLVNNENKDIIIDKVITRISGTKYPEYKKANYALDVGGKIIIECAKSLDNMMSHKFMLMNPPYLIPSKTDYYYKITLNNILFYGNNKQAKFKFKDTGYGLLSEFMRKVNIMLLLNDNYKIDVDMKDYYPIFIGQHIDHIQEVIKQVMSGKGNIAKKDHFGIFWTDKVIEKNNAGKNELNEYVKEVPYYKGNFSKDGGFNSEEVAPVIDIYQYANENVKFSLMDINLGNNIEILKDSLRLLILDKNKKENGFLGRVDLKCTDVNMHEKTIEVSYDKDEYDYMFMTGKDNKIFFWPFHLYHVDSVPVVQ
jgi:hypothetical protein